MSASRAKERPGMWVPGLGHRFPGGSLCLEETLAVFAAKGKREFSGEAVSV